MEAVSAISDAQLSTDVKLPTGAMVKIGARCWIVNGKGGAPMPIAGNIPTAADPNLLRLVFPCDGMC